jgi:hypothetical protein
MSGADVAQLTRDYESAKRKVKKLERMWEDATAQL